MIAVHDRRLRELDFILRNDENDAVNLSDSVKDIQRAGKDGGAGQIHELLGRSPSHSLSRASRGNNNVHAHPDTLKDAKKPGPLFS